MKSVLRRDGDYPLCWQQVALVAVGGGKIFPDVLSSFSNIFLIPPTLYRAAAAAAVKPDTGSPTKEEGVFQEPDHLLQV